MKQAGRNQAVTKRSSYRLYMIVAALMFVCFFGARKTFAADNRPFLKNFTISDTEIEGDEELKVVFNFDRTPDIQKEIDLVYRLQMRFVYAFDGGVEEFNYECSDLQVSGSKVTAKFKYNGWYLDDTKGKAVWSQHHYHPVGKYELQSISYVSGADESGSCTYNRSEGQFCLSDDASKTCASTTGSSYINYVAASRFMADRIPPRLRQVRLLTNTVTVKPAVIKYEIDIWDNKGFKESEGDVFGASEIKLIRSQKVDDGVVLTYLLIFTIDSRYDQDEFIIPDLCIYDEVDNSTDYIWDSKKRALIHDDEIIPAASVTLKDEYNYVVKESLIKKDLVSVVKKMKEGTAAKLTIPDDLLIKNRTAKAELFEAIKGKNVILVFEGIYGDRYFSWIINGKNVTAPCDVDLLFDTSVVKDPSIYGTTDPVIAVEFQNHGKLPGRMEVRIKNDYTFKILNLSAPVNIYYDDTENNELELEKKANSYRRLDGKDEWLCFSITHNSTFLASNAVLKRTLKIGSSIESEKNEYVYKVIDKNKVELSSLGYNRKVCTIPETVTLYGKKYKITRIGNYAFSGHDKLQTIKISEKIESIGKHAFENCKKLKEIVVPSSVSKIGKNAFLNCRSLKKLTLKTTKLTLGKVGSDAFNGTPARMRITVPASKIKAYKKILNKRGVSRKAVYQGAKKITLSGKKSYSKALRVGSFKLNMKANPSNVKLSYKSSDPKVLKVSKGKVKLLKAGSAKITVTASKKGYFPAQKIISVKVTRKK